MPVNVKPQALIVTRLLRELQNARRIGLGPGLPQLVSGLLGSGVQVFRLDADGIPPELLDVAVVEALEVAPGGTFSLPPQSRIRNGLQTRRWIVAGPHTHPGGDPVLVRACHFPVQPGALVDTVITELAVIQVNEVGLVLKEVAPGVATDEVKKKTAASLHVADDIRVMEL